MTATGRLEPSSGRQANGSNAAKNSTATFSKAGNYSFQVTITDAGGLSTTSTVNVTVNQTLSSINVTPATATLNENQTQQFSATGFDQFGNALTSQPSFTWSKASGVGSIDSSGLYTAPALIAAAAPPPLVCTRAGDWTRSWRGANASGAGDIRRAQR